LSAFTHGTNGRSTPAHSLDIDIRDIRPEINTPFTRGGSQAQSWNHEGRLINEYYPHNTATLIVLSINLSLPLAKQSEKVTTDSRIDRLTIWMQNVERECQPVACEVL